MDIQAARINARKCLDLSFKFQKLSPAARKLLSVFGGVTFEMMEKKPNRRMISVLKKLLCRRLEKLILIKDPLVRLMALKAMDAMGYQSRHLGLIATFYVSNDREKELSVQEELKRASIEIPLEAWRYVRHILEIPNYFTDLERCANHWEGVLRIDYTKEYSKEMYHDTSGKKTKWRERKVPPEEVKRRIAENKKEVRGLYRYALNEILEKKISGYYEKRQMEVYKCLDGIFAYLFSGKINDETRGNVLEMLAEIARIGHFPGQWLFDLSKKHVI